MPTESEHYNVKLAIIVQSEMWKAQSNQLVFDVRVVEWALANGVDPIRALNGPVFAMGAEKLAELREGLEL